MRKSEKELGDTKQILLRSAQKEFAKKGFAGTRMDIIAANAKLNKAMLYYYFGDKEKLYVTVLRSFFCNKNSLYNSFLKICQGMTPPEKLYAIVYFFLKIHLEVEEKILNELLAWEMAEGSKHFSIIIEEFLMPAITELEKILQEGVEKNIFFIKDISLYALTLMNIITSFQQEQKLFRNSAYGKKIFSENYRERFMKFVLEELLASILTEKNNYSFFLSPQILNKIESVVMEIKKEIKEL